MAPAATPGGAAAAPPAGTAPAGGGVAEGAAQADGMESTAPAALTASAYHRARDLCQLLSDSRMRVQGLC
eukprot:scaffold23168_cov125-Isochrysis_galbana.AAC.6